MARHIYTLSQETRSILTPHVQEIADEAGVTDKYLYQMLAGTETDPFVKFHNLLYAPAVRRGIDVSPWDAKLTGTRTRFITVSGQHKTFAELLAEAINSSAESATRLAAVLLDNNPTEAEEKAICEAVERNIQKLENISAKMGRRAMEREGKLTAVK